MPDYGPITDEEPRTRVRLPADESAPGQRRRSPWGSALAALAVIALVIAAVAFANRGADTDDEPSAGEGAPVPASGQAPSNRQVAGVATGFPHTRAGAESAATNYAVAIGSEQMLDDATRRRIIRAVADPAVEPAMQARMNDAFASLREFYKLDSDGEPPNGETFVYRALPVGSRLVSYREDAATVAVWTNGIIGVTGQNSTKPVLEAWHTITVTLRWVEGDWRWVSYDQKDGPTPVSGQQPASAADEIAEAVEKFGGYRYAR
jgi:hypothetical protein